MNLIYIAILALGAFIAIWMFVVVPSERKHHERKLDALRKQIEKREASKEEDDKYARRQHLKAKIIEASECPLN